MALAAVNNLDPNSYDREQLERQLSRCLIIISIKIIRSSRVIIHHDPADITFTALLSYEPGKPGLTRNPIFGLQRSRAHPIVVNCCGCQPLSNYVCDRRLLVAHINSART